MVLAYLTSTTYTHPITLGYFNGWKWSIFTEDGAIGFIS